MESSILESVVRLTEESEDSAPGSVEASPCKSPDVLTQAAQAQGEGLDHIADGIFRLNVNHPIFAQDGEEKSDQEDDPKKKDKKKRDKNLKDSKLWRIKATRSKITRPSKLVPYLKKHKDPLLGLEHLIEYQDENPSLQLMYACSLCEIKLTSENLTQLLQHLTGFKHRLNYLKQHVEFLENPFHDVEIESFDELDQLKRSDQSALVAKLAQMLEQKLGRKYKEIDVFVKSNPGYRQAMYSRQYAGPQAVNYNNYRRHKYPADSGGYMGGYAHMGGYGVMDAYMGGDGPMSFSEVLPLLYRCEIINEEDAGLALQASNYINKKILEFNTASRWNRKTQHHQHRPHGGGEYGNQPAMYQNPAGGGAGMPGYSGLVNATQRLSAEALQKMRWGSPGRGKAHVPYNH